MNEQDREVIRQAEPLIVGVIAVAFALRSPINAPSAFDRAAELYREFSRRFLD